MCAAKKLRSLLWCRASFIGSGMRSGITWKLLIYKPSFRRIQSTSSTARLTGTKLTPILDIARQPIWRSVRYRHHSLVDTWSFPTNFKKYCLFFTLVSLQLQWQHLMYRGLSRKVTACFWVFGSAHCKKSWRSSSTPASGDAGPNDTGVEHPCQTYCLQMSN